MRRDGYSVEVIATGDEILFGRITDTNSSWIARRVAELGARLKRVTCVGDDVDEIAGVVEEALGRHSDFILVTGGLGPSADDVTVEAVGRALGRGVVVDPDSAERIRLSYEERGIHHSSRADRMARILEGSVPVSNPVGLATGLMLSVGGKTIITFPGVPAEMMAMFDAHAAPLIEEGAPSRYVARTVVARVVFSDFFPVYRRMQRDYPDAYLKNAATPPESADGRREVREIKVDVVVEGDSREESEELMEEILSEFDRRLGEVGGRILR